MPNHSVILSLGSNIGDRREYLLSGLEKINQLIGTIQKQSNIYETEAWGVENQRGFFNQVVEISTSKSPQEILSIINAIESEMGRLRDKKWEARIIDIDILFYDNIILKEKSLEIPHSHLHLRNFILVPLLEIAPNYVHPIMEKTVRVLYYECKDKLKVYLN